MSKNPSHLIPLLSSEQNPKDFQSRFSKWISIDFLIDPSEMKNLFESLNPFVLISPFYEEPNSPHVLTSKTFLEAYSQFIMHSQNGENPNYHELKEFLFVMMMPSIEGVFLKPITSQKNALIFQAPYLEIKPIALSLSQVDHSLRVVPMQKSLVWWGLRCSYPQIVQDSKTLQMTTISQSEHPLGQLFKKFRIWIRENTRATPFVTDIKKVTHPIRLGKDCLSWIQKHPLLKTTHLRIGL